MQCHNCGRDHFLWDYKELKEIKEKLCSSSKMECWPPLLIHTGHWDGTLGPIDDKEEGDRGIS